MRGRHGRKEGKTSTPQKRENKKKEIEPGSSDGVYL